MTSKSYEKRDEKQNENRTKIYQKCSAWFDSNNVLHITAELEKTYFQGFSLSSETFRSVHACLAAILQPPPIAHELSLRLMQ